MKVDVSSHDLALPLDREWTPAPQHQGLSWRERLALIAWQYRGTPSIDCPVTHIFSPGQYTRVMRIPAGTFFFGRMHLRGHECYLIEGRVLHITEHDRRERVAPFWLHTVPGYQMVLYSLTDVIGRSVHPNPLDCRDIPTLERAFFEPWKYRIAEGDRVAARLTHQQEELSWPA